MEKELTFTREDYLTWFRLRQKFVETYTDYIENNNRTFNDKKDLIKDFTNYLTKVTGKDFDVNVEVSDGFDGIYYVDTEFHTKDRSHGLRCFTPIKYNLVLKEINGESVLVESNDTQNYTLRIEPDFYAYNRGIDSWETFDSLESLILRIPEKC